ncbi:MAG: hypothetical protein O3A33_00740 [Chloroflexi bacterium]|nr:hypothetical protein [Chloroflexota bacterium]
MGSDLVLTKPFGMEEFLEAIDNLMEQRTSQSSLADTSKSS